MNQVSDVAYSRQSGLGTKPRLAKPVLSQIGQLSDSPYQSIPMILKDIGFWVAASVMACQIHHPLVTVLAIIFIGVVPMHDFLAHAHEGIHGMISRRRWVNEFYSWLVHSTAFLSATAYRAFHMEHHRKAHTADDPEARLLKFIDPKMRGWAYLFVPAAGLIGINLYPFRYKTNYATPRTVLTDQVFAAMFHLLLCFALGLTLYATFVLAPLVLVLPVVSAIRSICEHHNAYSRERWRDTRVMKTSRLVEWLWSNVNYHLEHHLFPLVPFHKLPELHRLLAPQYSPHGVVESQGYLATALKLLCTTKHFRSGADLQPIAAQYLVTTDGLPFKMKVDWFVDILKCKTARQYLWSLYYAGEAYVELHPDGVYMPQLGSPYNRLLTTHLGDETRHASLFKHLLGLDGAELIHVKYSDDLGWFLLNSMVPDIVAVGRSGRPFSEAETVRYMAFLHTLELRSVSDLYALLCAARTCGDVEVTSALESILPDEIFHAVYTHKAVLDLTHGKRALANDLLDRMRRLELPLYTTSILGMVTELLRRGALPLTPAGIVRWLATVVLCHISSPFPVLPLYEAVPHKVAEGEKLRRFVPQAKRRPTIVA